MSCSAQHIATPLLADGFVPNPIHMEPSSLVAFSCAAVTWLPSMIATVGVNPAPVKVLTPVLVGIVLDSTSLASSARPISNCTNLAPPEIVVQLSVIPSASNEVTSRAKTVEPPSSMLISFDVLAWCVTFELDCPVLEKKLAE